MKKNYFSLITLSIITFTFGLISCGDEDEPVKLEVNLAEIILSAENKSSQDLTISSNAQWVLTGIPEWLDVSATSGTTTSTIKLTANSFNNSIEERSATLQISAESETKQVLVKQKAGLITECAATPNKIVVLSDGVAFDYKFGENVSFYYNFAQLSSEAGRLTDNEIVELCKQEGDRSTPIDDYVTSYSDLSPNTKYTIFTVAFDAQGNQGEIIKQEISTKSNKNQAEAYISAEGVDENYWYFTYTINAYCTKFYSLEYSSDTPAGALLQVSDAFLAWHIKNQNDSESPYEAQVNSQNWRLQRNADDCYLHLFTWGVDANGNYSGNVNRQMYEISRNGNIMRNGNTIKRTTKSTYSYHEYIKLKENTILRTNYNNITF